MIDHVIMSFVISIFGADGQEMEIDIIVLDISPYHKCLSNVACARLGDNHIFLDVNEFHQRDDCGRNPLVHELLHFKYPDGDVHNDCQLTI